MTPTPSNTAINDGGFKPAQAGIPGPSSANPSDYLNNWQSALNAVYKQSAQQQGIPQGTQVNPLAFAAAVTNPQAFSAMQNLWAASAAQNGQSNVLPVALQMAANGDASFLSAANAAAAQAQALQQAQAQAQAPTKKLSNGTGRVSQQALVDHEKLAAASVQAAMTGVTGAPDFNKAQGLQGPGRKEGDDLAVDCQDERELKKQRRKQSNRESARRSRLRKQAECEELSIRVNKLSEENVELQSELEQMKQKCETLTSQNKRLQQELHSFAQGDSKRSKKEAAAAADLVKAAEETEEGGHGKSEAK